MNIMSMQFPYSGMSHKNSYEKFQLLIWILLEYNYLKKY